MYPPKETLTLMILVSKFKSYFTGDVPELEDKGVIIINTSQYSRYRSVLKRVQGVEKHWMHNSLIVSLGGFTTPTRKTHILFCREIFDYAELEEHPYLCNHLGTKIQQITGCCIDRSSTLIIWLISPHFGPMVIFDIVSLYKVLNSSHV